MRPTLLKHLARARHLSEIRLFTQAYDRAAAQINPNLVGTGPSAKQLIRWFNGGLRSMPYPHHCQVLERMFPGHSAAELLSPYQEDSATPAPSERGRDEEAATNRRDTLRAGTAALAGLLLHQVISEPDHMHAALDAGSVGENRLAFLEHTADDLGRRMVSAPRVSLLNEALASFASVRALVREPQRTADRVRLIRTGAKLAILVSEILFGENELAAARQWAVVGYRAGLDVNDRVLADLALAKQANIPAYSGNPRGVLALVDPRLDGAPPPVSTGVAALWAAKARAHAMLGEDVAFRHAVNRSRNAIDAAPAETNESTDFTFPGRRLAFYECTSLVRLGKATEAFEAADRALAGYEPGVYSNEPALIRLDRAMLHLRDGDVPEACRNATEALRDPDSHPAPIVLTRAGEFDRMLGDERTAHATDWHDALHEFGQHRARPPEALT